MKINLRGIGASPGVGIGKTLVYRSVRLDRLEREILDRNLELERYRSAVERFCALRTEKAQRHLSSDEKDQGEILLAQAAMAKDAYLTGQVEGRIAAFQSAEAALDAVCGDFVKQFLSAENEVTRLRAADIRDVRDGVLRLLLGLPEADFSDMAEGTVLVAEDLLPSAMMALDPKIVAGIVLCKGGRASHSAILARALEIPTVVGAVEALSWAANGEMVIVNGETGEAMMDPNEEELEKARNLRALYMQNREGLKRFAGRQTASAGGARVHLTVSVGSEGEALAALESGCDGIGLLRSEFMFLDRPTLPEEEEQVQAYKRFVQLMGGKSVVIRTLDIGGDKRMPGISWDWENNPVLGCRAVRFSLRNEELLRTQLRAILRAGAFGDVRMMIPMITCLDELQRVKRIIGECKQELWERGLAFRQDMPVGIMMETPASALIADLLAQEADFFSIGMNDLTQYTMAVDRDNARVAYLYSYYNPAVLRAMQQIVTCAKAAEIPVYMCGQAAADPLFVPLLMGLELNAFSVQPSSLLPTRRIVSQWTLAEARALLRDALSLKTEAEVHDLLEDNERY